MHAKVADHVMNSPDLPNQALSGCELAMWTQAILMNGGRSISSYKVSAWLCNILKHAQPWLAQFCNNGS